uniref:Heat shock protein 70 n=1 Tax=Panagrolaimus sp. PS1159 TaxID=55785 RepID=A0AC35F1Y2_9BILA
ICERNSNGTKYETEFTAPAKGKWKLKLHCDINGILSVNYHVLENITNQKASLSKSMRRKISSLKFSDYELKNLVKMYEIPKMDNVRDDTINAVGIDLGTTRCCVAVNRINGITTVPLDNTGERLLPSYVSYDEENVKCGNIVVDRLRNFSKSSIFDSKRIIGKMSEEIDIFKSWPFGVTSYKNMKEDIEDDNALIQTESDNKKIIKFPEEIAAVLLKNIKQKAEEFQGKKLSEAVITVPATFKEEQKRATLAAAKLVGWETVYLLPEPIAAAFAYFIDRPIPNNSNVLLFDLGGGTLDVCIFKIVNDRIEFLSSDGDAKLGGRDFDDCLVKYFTNELTSKYGIHEIEDSNNGKYKLILRCQKIKEHLSVAFTEQLDIAEFDPSQDKFITITRDEFEFLASDLLIRIKTKIQSALKNVKNIEIHKILLVGGGCRMPMIKKLLKEQFPNAYHSCEEHPDEVVAMGAAYYSYYLNTIPGKTNKFVNERLIKLR